MHKLTDRQLNNLQLIASHLSCGTRVTSYYGAYWLHGALFKIGYGAMAQLYRKGMIEDMDGGVQITTDGRAALATT